MNAPTVTEQRDVLLFLSDPHRREELLKLIGDAEAAEAKANEAKAAAEIVLKANEEALAKERELQAINTGKSAKLSEERAALADQVKAHEFNKADDNKRMGEWEGRLKAQHDAQAEVQAELDRKINALADERQAFQAEMEAATETIAKAERIRAASEG
jgi:hypothetical protein